MPTPHVHAELIKAWADGAEIEYKNHYTQNWTSRETPKWDNFSEYRIKQTPKPKVTRWLWAYKFPQDTSWKAALNFLTQKEFDSWTSAKGFKLTWSATEFEE